MPESVSQKHPPLFSFAPPIWLDSIDSTNDELKRRLADGPPAGTVIAARFQTNGKGRMGRTWLSSPAAALMFSFLWRGRVPLAQLGTLPMACALGVRDFLKTLGIDSLCKWPNDIMTGAGKICGILAESLPVPDGEIRLVIGIGVNVFPDPDRDGRIEQPAACIARFVSRPESPNDLLPALLRCLENRINAWQCGGFAAVGDDFKACLWGVGRFVTVRTGAEPVVGAIRSVGENGELQLSGEGDRIITVISAAALDFGPPADSVVAK